MSSFVSPLPRLSRAPEFRGLGPWHNSDGLLIEELRGKVILVDFWTYTCVNCIRTLPHILRFWETYGAQGADGLISMERTPFVLIGIHTPEFLFERSERNVAQAIERYGLTYPVAQDNEYETWQSFANRYWPAKYLIDAKGYIRYTHFGEGAYEETADAIEELLREAGLEAQEGGYGAGERTGGTRMPLTPETYLGESSWPSLGNGPPAPTGDPVSYQEPHMTRLHHYSLVGDWQLRDGERQVLLSEDGEIRMRFLGGEINLVLGLEEEGGYAEADVFVDDTFVQSLVIDRPDLYRLYEGPYGEHELSLRIKGAGVAGYAFTFGQ